MSDSARRREIRQQIRVLEARLAELEREAGEGPAGESGSLS